MVGYLNYLFIVHLPRFAFRTLSNTTMLVFDVSKIRYDEIAEKLIL